MGKRPVRTEDEYWMNFWLRVHEVPSGCWEWQGFRQPSGHGRVQHPDSRDITNAHRVAYIYAEGAIPDGMVVRHKCDNPPCCRPAHLILGKQVDNIADMDARGRRRSHAKLGADDVLAIRGAYAGGASLKTLAGQYGCSLGNIHAIVNRRSWKEV